MAQRFGDQIAADEDDPPSLPPDPALGPEAWRALPLERTTCGIVTARPLLVGLELGVEITPWGPLVCHVRDWVWVRAREA